MGWQNGEERATYWIVLPDCASFRKHRAFFYKREPLIQGHKIGDPRLQHLLNFTLRRENPQTKRFLVQFKNAYTVVNRFSGKVVKLVPPDVRF